MLKFGFYVLLLCFATQSAKAQMYKARVVFDIDTSLLNHRVQIHDIDEALVVLDTFLTDSIFIYDMMIEEPKILRIWIITGTVMNSHAFYIYKNIDTIRIDDYIYFHDSPLNQEFYRLDEVSDRMSKLMYTLKFNKENCLPSECLVKADSVLIALQWMLMEEHNLYYESHPESFITLNMVKNRIEMGDRDTLFTKKLFASLHPNLYHYPSYKYCKENINKHRIKLHVGQDLKSIDHRDGILKLDSKKYTYLDFWSMYCGPCLKQLPALQDIQNKYADVLQIVCLTKDQDKNKNQNYFKQKSIQLPNYFLDGKNVNNLQNQFGVTAIPYGVLIDPEGVIIQKFCTKDALLEFLESVKK